MQSPVGALAIGDLLVITENTGFRVAFAKLFFRLADGEIAALVEILQQEAGSRFSEPLGRAGALLRPCSAHFRSFPIPSRWSTH